MSAVEPKWTYCNNCSFWRDWGPLVANTRVMVLVDATASSAWCYRWAPARGDAKMRHAGEGCGEGKERDPFEYPQKPEEKSE